MHIGERFCRAQKKCCQEDKGWARRNHLSLARTPKLLNIGNSLTIYHCFLLSFILKPSNRLNVRQSEANKLAMLPVYELLSFVTKKSPSIWNSYPVWRPSNLAEWYKNKLFGLLSLLVVPLYFTSSLWGMSKSALLPETYNMVLQQSPRWTHSMLYFKRFPPPETKA